MAIKTKQAPPAAADALRSGLGQMRGLSPERSRAMPSLVAGGSTIDAGVPHETYNLGLDDVRARRGVDAADHVGWRYILGQESQPDAGGPRVAAEVHTRGGTEFEFGGINQGPFVQQMVDVMKRVEPELGDATYEPRLLRIPAIYVAALWLKADGYDDLFVPLAPSNPALEPGRLYKRDEFEKAIGKAADDMSSAEPAVKKDSPHAP